MISSLWCDTAKVQANGPTLSLKFEIKSPEEQETMVKHLNYKAKKNEAKYKHLYNEIEEKMKEEMIAFKKRVKVGNLDYDGGKTPLTPIQCENTYLLKKEGACTTRKRKRR